MKYIEPQSGLKAFTCPHCGVLARQYHYTRADDLSGSYGDFDSNPVRTSKCEHCDEIGLWYFDKMVYPSRGNAPVPNPDMPPEIKVIYEEAASISTQSPRGAAALLRLAIQKLTVNLGESGKNINNDIASLVKKGLPIAVQQALDVVRVVGNNAVHPGQINTDDPAIVGKLFSLINVITEYMISMPNRVGGLFDELPPASKEAIAKRDEKLLTSQ